MTAKQLTDSILQMAIQGKLVPQDPNDEPASVLLERIREEKRRLVTEGKLKKKDLEEVPIEEYDIPYDVPDGWTWCRISDLFLHASGKQQSANNKKIGSLRKYITTSNLYWNRFVLDNLKEMYFSDDEVKSCSAQKGDLLVCEGGAGYGRSAIWSFDYDICLQNHVHRLRPYLEGICEYVYYLIFFLKETNQLASVGMAMPGLSANRLKGLLVPLPALAEQHRIVERIEEYLPVIKEYGEAYEEASKMDAELPDKLKKSILQEAIMGKLGTQDPSDAPASCLLEDIRAEKQKLVEEGVLKKKDLIETPVEDDEVPFNIPESWTWIRFGDLVFTSTGKTPARGEVVYWSSNDYPWVSISDMKQGEVVNSTKEFISKKAANDCFHNEISKKGTLIMSFKLTVGRTSILGMDAFHNEAIISIKTYADNDNYTRDYLAYILPIIANSGDSKDAIKGKTLNSKSIYNLLVPLPPLAEQHRIVQKIEELYAEIDNMTVENNININEIEVTDNE